MKLRSFVGRLPKRSTAVLSIIAATLFVPALLNAWGPARTTFTVAQPADHVVFNSITDNPVVGDERQFVGIKDNTNTAAGGWQNSVVAQPGHEYLVRVYIHNNAAANLNLVAQNTRVTAALSTATGKSVPITAYVSADNASPQKVWADVSLTSAQDFNIAYVPGSAMLYNNVTGQAGRGVSDSIVNPGGALVGYQSNDGKIPGCFQYAGYLTFKVKAQFAPTSTADFTVAKTVSKHGANQWVENYTAQPGETVDYLLEYKNTGTVVQNNVMVSDKLPAGMTYVAGSSVLGNPTNPGGVKTNDGVTSGGLNVGGYNPGQNAWIIFSAKVPSEAALACGTNAFTNTENVETDYGSKSDTAVVTVNKTCAPVPVYTCDSLTVDKISRTEHKFTVAKTVTNATYVKTVFVIKNAAGTVIATVDDVDGVYSYTQTTPGAYTVTATIVVTVDGTQKTATSVACAKPFTVEPETTTKPAVEINKTVNGKETAEVKVNEQFQYEIVVKNTGDVDLVNAKVSDTAPAGITFISADAGTIANNTWTATVSLKPGESKTFKITAVAKAYIAGATVNKACVDAAEVTGNPDDCDTAQTTMPELVTACNLDTKKIEQNIEKSKIDDVHYTLDLNKCKETPKPEEIQVCRLDDTKVVTITKDEYNAHKSKYSTDLNDCVAKPAPKCPIPGKETMPADSPDCKTIPAELPHTGLGDDLASMLGAGSLVGVASAFVASRRAVKQN